MKLEDIGFYTLSNTRCINASKDSPLWRAELLITDICNLHCRYCRGLDKKYKGNISPDLAKWILGKWIDDGLVNVRFSGGEPLLNPQLYSLVKMASRGGVKNIAISTNGTMPAEWYYRLADSGVNDFSISLDACCSTTMKRICGKNIYDNLCKNIELISKISYATVGIVLTLDNLSECLKTVQVAHSLGVSDIRIIPSAQHAKRLPSELSQISDGLLENYPILKYRVKNIRKGKAIRGLTNNDNWQCPLVLDDVAVVGGHHFPCIIYLREGGNPIGRMEADYRWQRFWWFNNHNCLADSICKNNCLDVCRDYNNKYKYLKEC